MRTVYGASVEELKEKSERDVVLSALRFRWEVFRICLDLTKSNPNFELVAKEFAKQAFEFCHIYHRRNEFRRLCEILRGYLSNSLGYSKYGGSHNMATQSPETLLLLINVRFDQLQTAIALELWQEAFRSIEDLHGLFVIYKRSIDPSLMVSYYEGLVKIFQMSGDSLFHAAAWIKLLKFIFSFPSPPPAETLTQYCSSALLAALSISSEYKDLEYGEDDEAPGEEEEDPKSRESKYTALLGLEVVPTREDLIKTASDKKYYKYISTSVKELADVVQKTEFVQEDAERFFKLAAEVESCSNFKGFLVTIRRVMAQRYLQQISFQKQHVSFDELMQMTKGFFDAKSFFDLEAFLFGQNHSPSCRVVAHVDHITSTVSFSPAQNMKPDENYVPQRVSSGEFIDEIQKLLTDVTESKLPEGLFNITDKLKEFNARIEAERSFLLNKQQEYESAYESFHATCIQRENEEAAQRAIKLQEDRERDKARREVDAKKKQHDKLMQEREQLERTDKLKLIEEVNRKLSMVKRSLDPEIYVSSSKSEILREQARLLDEAKKEIDIRFSSIGKRMDHKERAIRLEESPLIQKQYERQEKDDELVFQNSLVKKKEDQSVKRREKLRKISSAAGLVSSSRSFFEVYAEQQTKNLAAKSARMKENLALAKQKLKDEVLEARYIEAVKREKEEQASRLDEIAQKQREKEAEIERRLAEKRGTPTYIASQSVTESAAAASTTSASTTAGKYVPRHKKATA